MKPGNIFDSQLLSYHVIPLFRQPALLSSSLDCAGVSVSASVVSFSEESDSDSWGLLDEVPASRTSALCTTSI